MDNIITVEILFWSFAFIVFYTFLGYAMLLYGLVKVKEFLTPAKVRGVCRPEKLPEVTLLIAAYNEQDVVDAKMRNSLDLDYPAELLTIAWVSDGSTDSTNELLGKYKDVTVIYDALRGGKASALNHAIAFIKTPIVIFTDANTMVCRRAVREIVAQFENAAVGCVAGEKRIAQLSTGNATAGEGIYWRYESKIKELDYRLNSAVGAAGELFAIRTELYIKLPTDTLLDDFVLSMKIAQQGYKIAYCKDAYAIENSSVDIGQEAKRKVRIAAGGWQSIARLRGLLNIFKYGTLSFQYISHRVLRWSITPFLWFALLPLNVALAIYSPHMIYVVLLAMQIIFYALAIAGYALRARAVRYKAIFTAYYFLFMNVCAIKGLNYLRAHRGSGVWEKALRGR